MSKYFGDSDTNGTEHYKSDRTKIKQFPSPLTHSAFLTLEAHSIPPRSTPSVIKFYYSFLSLYPFLFRFFKLHSSKANIFPASPGTSPLLRYFFFIKKIISMLACRVVCRSHQSDCRIGYVSRTNQTAALRCVFRTNHITAFRYHAPITVFEYCFLVNDVMESWGCAQRMTLTRNF